LSLYPQVVLGPTSPVTALIGSCGTKMRAIILARILLAVDPKPEK
jgi:hypothetical protein